MLAEVREKYGLGSPPKDYNQNANEAINSLIKRAKGPGKLSLKETIQFLQKEVRDQEENVKFALLKSAFLIVFRMLVWGEGGGRGFVGPFLSHPTYLRKRSISEAVKSTL